MNLKFTKMQGCGNDFLILDFLRADPPVFYENEIQLFCDRHFGIGADGLIILTSSDTAHAKWKFYNADGSEANMCGNGARCAIRYLTDNYHQGVSPICLETNIGVIKGKVLENSTNVELALFYKGEKSFQYEEKTIRTEAHTFELFFINTGVPHAVIEVKDIFAYPILAVGKELRNHPAFGPEGTNVTFFSKLVGKRIRSTTFERGVEHETLACGTGVAAAAIIFATHYLQMLPVEVVTPGGEMIVDLSPISQWLVLQGPAEYVFTVEINHLRTNFERPALFSQSRKGRL